MNSPKVSIIVGCYNVSKWLNEGRLNDIYNQSFSDWELILVDDGSTDESGCFIDEEAKKDRRIKVIHKENGGLGSARNAGLNVAQGKYIWSFDVDDHVNPNSLESLIKIAEDTDAEMLCFGYIEHNIDLKTQTKYQFDCVSCHNNEEVKSIYLDHLLLKFNNGFFWNKMYRRDFIEKNHLRFGSERIQQDEVFNLQVYKYLNHLEIISGVFYHYYIYNSGNNRSRFIPDRYNIYKNVYSHFCDLRDFWRIEDVRLNTYLCNRLFENLNVLLRYNLVHPQCTWNKDRRVKEMIRVMEDKDFREAIVFKEGEGLDLENRIFLWAYRKHSLKFIEIINPCFFFLRYVKHRIWG